MNQTTPPIFVYSVEPIDDWAGWLEPEAFFLDQASWQEQWSTAQALARDLGFDGDIREGPFMTVLPHPLPQRILIAWKGGRDGICYIASPFELPWL